MRAMFVMAVVGVTVSSSTIKDHAVETPSTDITEPTFGPPIESVKVRQLRFGGIEDAFLDFMLAENASPYAPKHAGTLGLLDALGTDVHPTTIKHQFAEIGGTITFQDVGNEVGYILPHERLFAALQQSTVRDLSNADAELIRNRVARLRTKLQSDNNALYAYTEHGAVAVTYLPTFQASPFEATAVNVAFAKLLAIDGSLGTKAARDASAISTGYMDSDPDIKKINPDIGGRFYPSIQTESVLKLSDRSITAAMQNGKSRYHEHAHKLWDRNDDRYGPVDADGKVRPISSKITSKIDHFMLSIANEANAIMRETAAELLSDLAILNDPAHPDYAAAEKRVVHLVHNYGGLMDKIREAAEKGLLSEFDFEQIKKESIEQLKKYVAVHKDIPPSMRVEIFLANLKQPTDLHVKTFFADAKDRTFTGDRITLSATDLVDLTRDVDGVSYLSKFVAENPDFMQQIEQYPWAQTLQYPEAEQLELMQLARTYGFQFDLNNRKRFTEAEVQYEAAIAANYHGAFAAFKKMVGFSGNDLSGGGRGGGDEDDAQSGILNSFPDIKDRKQRDIISTIMYGFTVDDLAKFESKFALAAIKEMMIEVAAPTDRSKVQGHPFTSVNIEGLANMMSGKQVDMVAFIAANAPAGVDVKKLTYTVMADVRKNKIATLISVYTNAQFETKSELLWWRIKGLKRQIEHASASDNFFRDEITKGIRQPIDLRIVEPSGRTNARIFRNLRKQYAVMKAAEERAAAVRPAATKTPTAKTDAVSQPSYP